MKKVHWFFFWCDIFSKGDDFSTDKSRVTCKSCMSKFRDVELPDAPACGGAQVDTQDIERTTENVTGKTA